MRLFIAEKPSLGRAIAEGLGGGQKQSSFITCGQDTVTWCFGHMLELAEPDDYDPSWKQWRREILPIIPSRFQLKPREKAADQLALIGKLLRQATSVVNAGDPDREGQLLIDEVLEHFGYRGPAERIWLASLDPRSVAKALANLADNTAYAPLRDAARARSQADWLVGLNATRAMTILGREAGRQGVLSLGRVQTPTLNLVVMRDREIAAFKPIDYFVLQGSMQHPAGPFIATFQPGETQAGLDSDGRLVDATVANSIAGSARDATATVTGVTREKKQKAPPLPHCLSSLQKAASSRWGMTAQQVLDTAQKLYEQKLTTYPRSDCRYLPVEQLEDAGRILGVLATVPGMESAANGADAKLKSAVWDTAKVTAHHAIIPTGEIPGNLPVAERNIYTMIATAYCLQFYPALRYESQKIRVDAADTAWEARGRLILEPGWTQAHGGEDGDEEKADQSLPAVAQGDAVTCADVELLKKKTTPPSRFTEGTLIEAMANIHRFVDDPSAKISLKENEGIGTEATRAKILEALKFRDYLKPNGKALVSTAIAGQVMDLTPPALKDPVTTALWESRLEAIAQGKATLADFMSGQIRAVPELVDALLGSGGAGIRVEGPVHPCPKCGKPLQKRTGDKGPYWACMRKATPEPSEYNCPQCGKALIRRKGISAKSKKPYDFFGCSDRACNQTFDAKGGKPDFGGK